MKGEPTVAWEWLLALYYISTLKYMHVLGHAHYGQ